MPFSHKITSGFPIMQRLAYPVCALMFSGLCLALFFNTPSPDLSALYLAGYAVANGLPDTLYALGPEGLGGAPAAEQHALIAEIGLRTTDPVAPFVYPPLWAWLVAPFTELLTLKAFQNGVLVLHVAMLSVSVGLAWKVVRPPHMTLAQFVCVGFAFLAVSAPAIDAIAQNTPQIATLFLVLLAFERYRASSFAMAGMILAVAAAFKLSPLFLVLIFILERNARATGAFALTGAALAAMSVALAGWPLHARFLGLLADIDAVILFDKSNYAPEVVLYQLKALLTGSTLSQQPPSLPEPFWLSTVMAALMLAALAALILMRPRLVPGTAVPVLLLGFGLATALFGPVSWALYFTLPLLLLPTLFHIMSRKAAWRWIIAIGALQSLPLTQLYAQISDSLYVTSLMGVLCYMGLLVVLVGLVFRAVRFQPDVPLPFR
ncbi:glycosyltransferase family 87 protein [Lentibacter sp.]|uniref:glycosyltransferase family 87 protein n=1 Tax=Lentibacter sp. TaxID=2024994 RepID=UPI003F6A0AEB